MHSPKKDGLFLIQSWVRNGRTKSWEPKGWACLYFTRPFIYLLILIFSGMLQIICRIHMRKIVKHMYLIFLILLTWTECLNRNTKHHRLVALFQTANITHMLYNGMLMNLDGCVSLSYLCLVYACGSFVCDRYDFHWSPCPVGWVPFEVTRSQFPHQLNCLGLLSQFVLCLSSSLELYLVCCSLDST